MRIRKLNTDPWGDPIYSWGKGWEGDGPRFILYRPVCWLLGHQPRNYELVNPATGHRTPITWCSLCGKEAPRPVGVEVIEAPLAVPVATQAQLAASVERLALGRGLSYEQARRYAHNTGKELDS